MTAMRLKRYPSAGGGIALGKMGVGATLVSVAKTARDYVQDGLIAMWDGIENAGWGVHDANVNSVVDLTGNGFDLASSYLTVSSNSFGYNRAWSSLSLTYANLMPQTGSKFSLSALMSEPDAGDGLVCGFYASSGWYGFRLGLVNIDNLLYPICRIGSSNLSYTNVKFHRSSIRRLTLVYDSGFRYYLDGTQFGDSGTTISSALTSLRFFNGNANTTQIYNTSVYNRALTAAEIAANYAIDKERFNLP